MFFSIFFFFLISFINFYQIKDKHFLILWNIFLFLLCIFFSLKYYIYILKREREKEKEMAKKSQKLFKKWNEKWYDYFLLLEYLIKSDNIIDPMFIPIIIPQKSLLSESFLFNLFTPFEAFLSFPWFETVTSDLKKRIHKKIIKVNW